MNMKLLICLCLGGFYVQIGDSLSGFSEKSKLGDLIRTYKVVLSNTGPVIPGSNITFIAHLEDKQGLPLSDVGKYHFRWSSNADRITYKEILNANRNSTWKRCFNTIVQPQEYHVSVAVFEKDEIIIEKKLANESQKFRITDTLNGNICASQPLRYRHLRKDKPVYSTSKNFTLKLNLTDSALQNSTLVHECDWYLDGEFIGNTTNITELVTECISDVGLHNFSAFLKFYQIPDCYDSMTPLTSNRSGTFNLSVNLKDPVEVVNVRGRSDVKIHHPLELGVYFSGSPPFNACWSVQPMSNQSKILNESCSIEQVENEQNFTIFMNKTSLVSGQYVINITIINDVSMVEKRHFITVYNPLPYHGPASVLLPVVGGLIAVTLLLAVTVYGINKRMARKHVETANFDFHPPTIPLVNSGEHKLSFLDKLQEGLFKVFGTSNCDLHSRRTASDLHCSQSVYGSNDNSMMPYA